MREIKFRAWYPKYRTWLDARDVHIDLDGNWWWMGEECCDEYDDDTIRRPSIEPLSGVVITQYISLKDKNGKKIYEGDILQYNKRMYEVKWQRAGFWFECKNPCPVVGDSVEPTLICSSVEIVGNIYETPELLE